MKKLSNFHGCSSNCLINDLSTEATIEACGPITKAVIALSVPRTPRTAMMGFAAVRTLSLRIAIVLCCHLIMILYDFRIERLFFIWLKTKYFGNISSVYIIFFGEKSFFDLETFFVLMNQKNAVNLIIGFVKGFDQLI